VRVREAQCAPLPSLQPVSTMQSYVRTYAVTITNLLLLDIPRLSYPVGGQSAVALDRPRREGGRRVLHYILPAAGNAAPGLEIDKRKLDNCPWITGPCRT
jgi:hypothetical protein